jgi:PLP dependent protein
MNIAENIRKLKKEIPENITLVAVSKTKPIEDIKQAIDANHLILGENKALELRDKHEILSKEIQWHYIGHLQTNKVKYIAPFVHLFHAVDSLKLMKEINKQAVNNNRTINYLLQFHIAEEESKFGLNLEEATQIIESDLFNELGNIQCVGVMGMASYTKDKEQIRKEFKELKSIFNELKDKCFSNDTSFKEISMGMTNDYQIAIEEGSTILRIGSLIFGERN